MANPEPQNLTEVGAPPENPAGAGAPPVNPAGAGAPPENPAGAGAPPENPAGAGAPPENPDGAGAPSENPDGAGAPPENPAEAGVLPENPVGTAQPRSGVAHVKQRYFPPHPQAKAESPDDLDDERFRRPISPIDVKVKPAESGTLKTPKPVPPRPDPAPAYTRITESPDSIGLRHMCSDFLEYKRKRLSYQRSMEQEMKTLFPKMDQLLKSLEELSARISSIPSIVPTDDNELRSENDRLNYLIISSAGIFKHIDDMMGPLKDKAENFTEMTTNTNLGIDERLKRIITTICDKPRPFVATKPRSSPAPPTRGPGSGAPPAPPAPGSSSGVPPTTSGSASGSSPAPPGSGSGAPGSSSGAPGAPSTSDSSTKPVTKEIFEKALSESMARVSALCSASEQALDASGSLGKDIEVLNFPLIPETLSLAKDPGMVSHKDVSTSISGSKIVSSVVPEKESKAGVAANDEVLPPDSQVEEIIEGQVQSGQESSAVAGTPELGQEASAVAGTPELGQEATAVAGTPEQGQEASAVAGTPELGQEASAVAGTPELGQEASAVAGTPELGQEASALVGAPEHGKDASEAAGTPDVKPGVEASKLVGAPESGVDPGAQGAERSGNKEVDYKMCSKFFP